MSVCDGSVSLDTNSPRGILILSLTTVCACRCVFCGIHRVPRHTYLDKRLLVAALENPPGTGVWREVNITGGDPLAVPATSEYFSMILDRRQRYQQLSVSTAGIPSGVALATLRRIAERAPVDVFVSLDGVGDAHDVVRGRLGAFREVRRFLDGARSIQGVSIALTCVINRLNVDHLDEIADLADAIHLPISYALVNNSDHYIRSQPLYPFVQIETTQVDVVAAFLRRRSRQRLDEELQRVLAGGKRRSSCRLLHEGFLVTSDGTISLCGTSSTMILGRPSSEGGMVGSWREVAMRRSALLEAGAAMNCQSCTSNCYAWRRGRDDESNAC